MVRGDALVGMTAIGKKTQSMPLFAQGYAR